MFFSGLFHFLPVSYSGLFHFLPVSYSGLFHFLPVSYSGERVSDGTDHSDSESVSFPEQLQLQPKVRMWSSIERGDMPLWSNNITGSGQ